MLRGEGPVCSTRPLGAPHVCGFGPAHAIRACGVPPPVAHTTPAPAGQGGAGAVDLARDPFEPQWVGGWGGRSRRDTRARGPAQECRARHQTPTTTTTATWTTIPRRVSAEARHAHAGQGRRRTAAPPNHRPAARTPAS